MADEVSREPLGEFEIRYWRSDEPPPPGWVRHDGLDDTHHGKCREDGGFTIIVRQCAALCQCGKPLKIEDRSHGTFCQCGRQLESCCGE